MCSGYPVLKIGSIVRRLRPLGREALVSAVLGEVIDIDKTDKRKFVYYVRWDGISAEIGEQFRRSEIVKTSRVKHARDVETVKRQILERKRTPRIGDLAYVTIGGEWEGSVEIIEVTSTQFRFRCPEGYVTRFGMLADEECWEKNEFYKPAAASMRGAQ